MGDEPVARPLPTQDNTNKEEMPGVGSEPMIQVFERTKTVHVLERAAILNALIVISMTPFTSNSVTIARPIWDEI
jgi:hypothetical protein